MTIHADIMNSLKSLPCFDEIKAVSLLAEGLSQTAVKVTTSSQVFFAKKLNQETANTEVCCALLCTEHDATDGSCQDSKPHLSPEEVIYHDQQWLVTAFINGISLADAGLKNDVKISTALRLMAELHQLPTSLTKQSIEPLNPSLSIKRLLTNPVPLLAKQSHFLDKTTKSLTTAINSLVLTSESSSVLCHGDINFTNILIDDEQRSWLIDFECAQLAPVEFDLAMFIAVNNIATDQVSELVNRYKKLVPTYQPNDQLLTYYILFSFYINGLWYFDNINEWQVDKELPALARKQWSAFDSFASEKSIGVPKLMSIVY